jgi:type I restriction enzyme S subunit
MAKDGTSLSTATPRLRFPEFRDAPAWEVKYGDDLFDDRAEDGRDQLPIYSVTMDDGVVPRSSLGRKVDDISDTAGNKRAHRGDIVYNMMRVWQGASGVAPEECMVSPAYVVLAPHQDVRPEFYGYFFKLDSSLRLFTSHARGANKDRLRLYYDSFAKTPLPHPSLAEQQKIAECLTSLDECIAAQGKKVDALAAHKKALMQQLFPREGESAPRLRFPEFRNAGEWEPTTLGELGKISSGTTPARANSEFFEGGTIPWVKTTDLNNSVITVTEECITTKAAARINPVGSVLVAMYGGFKQIGRTGILGVPAATNQAMSVLVVDGAKALPVYVLTWLNAKVDDWKRIASSSRKDPNVTGSDVAGFPIQLPSTVEQQRIAACLGSLDARLAAESAKLAALKTHKKGLMQQLFPSPEGA